MDKGLRVVSAKSQSASLGLTIQESSGMTWKSQTATSSTAALPRPQEEEETDKSKQAQTEQTYEKH